MNDRLSISDDSARRRSRNVALIFLGAVGVVGGLVAWEAWQRAQAATTPQPAPWPSAPPVSADQTYANNAFIPGVGYYHAPYHAWFPHPYNYYDASRGYFAGGFWQAAPFVLGMLASRPNHDAVAVALAAQRLRDEQERQRQQQTQAQTQSRASSGGYFHSFGSSGFSTARPGGSSSGSGSSGSSISRGGFGSSAHGSGGGGE